MKVKELIEKLQAFDGELKVFTVGEDVWFSNVINIKQYTVSDSYDLSNLKEDEISDEDFNDPVEPGEKVILIN